MTSLRPRLSIAALLAAFSAPASAGVFLAGQAGVSVVRELGESPPLCCLERERWTAPGGRLGAQLGYAFGAPVFVRADLGLALHQVAGEDHMQLRLLSPDAALYVGGQLRGSVTADLALGVGWRHFSGTARHAVGGPPIDREVSQSAADLRLAVGVRAPVGAQKTLGGELTLARVFADELVGTLSLVMAWDGL